MTYNIFQRGSFHVAEGWLALFFHDLWNGHTRVRFDDAVKVNEGKFEIAGNLFANRGLAGARRAVEEDVSHEKCEL